MFFIFQGIIYNKSFLKQPKYQGQASPAYNAKQRSKDWPCSFLPLDSGSHLISMGNLCTNSISSLNRTKQLQAKSLWFSVT